MWSSQELCWQGRGVGVRGKVGVTVTSSSHDAPLPAQWHTVWDVAPRGWDLSPVRRQIYFSTGCWWKSTDVVIWKRSGFIVKSQQQDAHTLMDAYYCVLFLSKAHMKLKQSCSLSYSCDATHLSSYKVLHCFSDSKVIIESICYELKVNTELVQFFFFLLYIFSL